MTDTHVVFQQTATVVVEVQRRQVGVKGVQPGALVVAPVMQTAVVSVGMQGPPGAVGDAQGAAFMVRNSLSEIAHDPRAQKDAQKNLGFGVEDPLAYYILAKS